MLAAPPRPSGPANGQAEPPPQEAPRPEPPRAPPLALPPTIQDNSPPPPAKTVDGIADAASEKPAEKAAEKPADKLLEAPVEKVAEPAAAPTLAPVSPAPVPPAPQPPAAEPVVPPLFRSRSDLARPNGPPIQPVPAIVPVLRAPDDPGVASDEEPADEFAEQIGTSKAQAGGWRGFWSRLGG